MSRQLRDEEKALLQDRLKDAKKRIQLLSNYVSGIEEQLKEGTTWTFDKKKFAKVCKDMEEVAHRDREINEQHEIEKYGRVLTDNERLGVILPPEKKEA